MNRVYVFGYRLSSDAIYKAMRRRMRKESDEISEHEEYIYLYLGRREEFKRKEK